MITEPIDPATPGHRMLASAFARWNEDHGGTLVELPEFAFPVTVSASARSAGERIARRAAAAQRVLKRILGVETRLSLAVLSRRDWATHAEVPAYGVSHRARDGRLIMGAEPADAWHAVSSYFGRRLATRARTELTAVHGVDAADVIQRDGRAGRLAGTRAWRGESGRMPSTIAAMCSGVVPQHPPTIFAPACTR